MKERRVPCAKKLEDRINLIERIQLLMFRKIKSFKKPDLDSHLAAVKGQVDLPLRVRLDLFEREIDDVIHAWMESDEHADWRSLVFRFRWWCQAEDQLDEAKLTLQHIMAEEVNVINRMPMDERPEKLEQLNQVSSSAFDSFFELHVEFVFKVYNATSNKTWDPDP